MPVSYEFDMDAARREAQVPKGIKVTLAKQVYWLAPELPEAVFDALLDNELDLLGLVRDIVAAEDRDSDSGMDAYVDVLLSRASLPAGLVKAIHTSLGELFGDEQYTKFRAGTGKVGSKPSVADLLRLVFNLLPMYGVSLGEALRSLYSSADDTATSKPTLPGKASTPAMPSAAPETPASSESGA
jgi:hypothetical protein